MSHLDPHTLKSEIEVRRILDIQSIAESMPDVFIDLAMMTRSHIPAANASARMDVFNVCRNTALEGRIVLEGGVAAPSKQPDALVVSQSLTITLKRGKPSGSKDS